MSKSLEERIEELERVVSQLVGGSADAAAVARLDKRIEDRLKRIEDHLRLGR